MDKKTIAYFSSKGIDVNGFITERKNYKNKLSFYDAVLQEYQTREHCKDFIQEPINFREWFLMNTKLKSKLTLKQMKEAFEYADFDNTGLLDADKFTLAVIKSIQ